MPTEGQTAIGPNGERAVFVGGQWIVQPAAQQMPMDPTYPYQGGKAAADLQNAVTNAQGNAIDNQVKSATANDIIAKAAADRRKAELDANSAADLARRGGLTPDQFDERQGRAARLNSLIAQINRTQELFDQGPGQTRGPAGILDYLPTDANAAFDTAGAALSQQGLAAFRVPGTGTVSDRDALMFDRANLPTAATRDAAIKEQLRGLRSRVEQEAAALGFPAPQWAGANAMDQAFVQGGDPTRALAAGSDQAVQQLPEAMRQEYAAYVAQNAGRIDPQAYAAFRNQLNAKYGFAGDGTDYAKEAASLNEYYSKGGRTFGNIPDLPKKLSTSEVIRNSAVNNPVGAAAVGAANMASFGLGEALTGDRMDMLRQARPYSTMGGEVLGSLAGTSALGRIGATTLGKIGPLNNVGRFGRNLATDTAYGAGYGTVTQGDPVTGALTGAVGSTLGQGVGSAIGRAAGGLAETPAAQYLRSQGIKGLTVGQRAGGWMKGVEDRLSGLNVIGDQVNARRMEGFRDYNAAEFRNAGQAIGAVPTDIGDRGLQQLSDAKSDAYSRFLDPAQIDTLNDPGLVQDVAQARLAASQIPNVQPTMPRDYAEQSLQNRLESPVDANGMMNGRAFQEAYRGLARDARSRTNSDYGHEIGQATRLGQDALAGALERQNPGAYEGFQAANLTNRRLSVLADAVNRARNGGRTGEVDVFAPSQFIDAAAANKNKFPGGFDTTLAKNAQEVMPNKIPDSGTAGRLALMALPGVLGGAGAGADQLGVSDNGLRNGLIIGSLLAAGGTKGGQKMLGDLLFERPKPLRDFGTLVRKNKGLFGSASIPLLLEAQQ